MSIAGRLSKHPDAAHVDYVRVTLPSCPMCGGRLLKTYHSRRHADGSSTRRTECRTCGHRFIVIAEHEPASA